MAMVLVGDRLVPALEVDEERNGGCRPTGPSITIPSLSGPRCTRLSFIAASASASGRVTPSSEISPQIPHTASQCRSEAAIDRI